MSIGRTGRHTRLGQARPVPAKALAPCRSSSRRPTPSPHCRGLRRSGRGISKPCGSASNRAGVGWQQTGGAHKAYQVTMWQRQILPSRRRCCARSAHQSVQSRSPDARPGLRPVAAKDGGLASNTCGDRDSAAAIDCERGGAFAKSRPDRRGRRRITEQPRAEMTVSGRPCADEFAVYKLVEPIFRGLRACQEGGRVSRESAAERPAIAAVAQPLPRGC